VLGHAFDSRGRLVVFDAGSYLHLNRRRPQLLDYVDAILATVEQPDFHELDPLPSRERFYKQHLDYQRWLRVVVSFEIRPARVITALIQEYDPRNP
jgi:hypothetical protein